MPPLDRVCNLAQYLQDRHGNLTIFQHKIYPPGITQPRLRDDFDKISCIPPGRPSEGVQGSWESFEHRAYTVIDDGIDTWSLVSSDVPQDGAAEAIEFDPQGLQQCDLCQGTWGTTRGTGFRTHPYPTCTPPVPHPYPTRGNLREVVPHPYPNRTPIGFLNRAR